MAEEKSMTASFTHRIEYIALRLVAGLVRLLPLRLALAFGWLVAAIVHLVGRKKVVRTHQRIRQVVGDSLSERRIRHIAWIAWRNLFFNGIEMMRCDKMTVESIQKHPISALGPQLLAVLENEPNGFIIATPHCGNWEIAAIAGDLSGLPLFVIARKQRNPLINAYINRLRGSFSVELLFREVKIFKGVVDRIKQGRVLAILPDIHAKKKGVIVDYLNNKAHIAPGAAQFAQLAKCPIYPVVMRRIGWMQHGAVLCSPIRPNLEVNKQEDQYRIMQEIMKSFSDEILKYPEQYFWYNKRWVLNK